MTGRQVILVALLTWIVIALQQCIPDPPCPPPCLFDANGVAHCAQVPFRCL